MRLFLLLSFWVMLMSASSWCQDRDILVQDCTTVSECLEIIEQSIPAKDNGRIFGDEKRVAAVLKARFDRDARDELLQKAIGEHGGWRNYAGGVLRYWNDWSVDDVPLLDEALALNPGGSIAHVLAEIGSEQAVLALLNDLTWSGGSNQTGSALRRLGPDVLKHVLPALAVPSYGELPEDEYQAEGWVAVASLIESFGSRATFIADEWVLLAKNRQVTNSERIAALRGLAAMNGHLGEKGAALRPLLDGPDSEISEQAYLTLVSTYDSTVARRFAETCATSGDKWDELGLSSYDCLSQLSDFGSNARDAGDLILPFLDAANKAEQLYGIQALGLIGYDPAIPKIEIYLDSPDWRLVYASVRALTQLRSKSSVPNIETATQNHWLWELKGYGRRAVSLLIRNQSYSEHLSGRFNAGFGTYRAPYDSRHECDSQVWTYGDKQITFEKSLKRNLDIPLADGELVGTNRGEWGGNLTWKPHDGSEIILVDKNTIDIFSIVDGFMSIHGLSHLGFSYGFATHVTRGEDGVFRAEEIARFPAAAYEVKHLGEGIFAAKAEGRVFIFSKDGIKAAANCDRSARPEK